MSHEQFDGLSRKRKEQIRQVLYEEKLLQDLPEGAGFHAADSVIPKSMTAKTDTVFELFSKGKPIGILHLEYQNENVVNMAERMLAYGGNIVQHYSGQKVYQYVVYTGMGNCTMNGELEQAFYTYRCKIVALNTIAFARFLASPDRRRWPMALLGNWQGHTAEYIVNQIMDKLGQSGVTSMAEAEEILQEFTTFGAMRKAGTVVKNSIRTMADVFPHYRDTNIFKELREEYRQEAIQEGEARGEARGKEIGKAEGKAEGSDTKEEALVLNLLQVFPPQKVSEYLKVPLPRVQKIAAKGSQANGTPGASQK